MARPSKPLISRDVAVAAALDIIDEVGLEAFSLPRLASALRVTAPALYHHFANKSEILAEVARAIVLQTRIPQRASSGSSWEDWLVNYGLNFRRVILRHHNAAPVLLSFLPADLVTDVWEEAAVFLEKSGVPKRLHVPILGGMEKLTLGVSLSEAMRQDAADAGIFGRVNPRDHPVLTSALERDQVTARQFYEQMMRSYLRGVMQADAADGNAEA